MRPNLPGLGFRVLKVQLRASRVLGTRSMYDMRFGIMSMGVILQPMHALLGSPVTICWPAPQTLTLFLPQMGTPQETGVRKWTVRQDQRQLKPVPPPQPTPHTPPPYPPPPPPPPIPPCPASLSHYRIFVKAGLRARNSTRLSTAGDALSDTSRRVQA